MTTSYTYTAAVGYVRFMGASAYRQKLRIVFIFHAVCPCMIGRSLIVSKKVEADSSMTFSSELKIVIVVVPDQGPNCLEGR